MGARHHFDRRVVDHTDNCHRHSDPMSQDGQRHEETENGQSEPE